MSLSAHHLPARAFGRRTAAQCRAAAVVIGAALFAAVVAALSPGLPARAAVSGALTGGSDTEVPAGLFFDAGREGHVFEAPVLASDVAIEINGQVARVKVRQRFVNPSSDWLEGIYIFPLPERSAVDRLVMIIGERRVEGRILEKDEAEKVYRQAAAEGRRASLLASARPNVFMTKVANIAPGAEIQVEIQYQDRAVYDDGQFNYRFPMVVAPRYTPLDQRVPMVRAPSEPAVPSPKAQPIAHGLGQEDLAGRADEPRARDLFGPVRHPEEGLANPLSLRITLDAGLPVAQLDSLYHEVRIEGGDGMPWQVALAEGPVPADRDFVLQWSPANTRDAQAAVFAEPLGDDSYLLVSLLPPGDPVEHDIVVPRDLVLVVDTSGSMHGPSIAQARKALFFALDRLRPEDRFNLVQFNSVTSTLFSGVRPASPRNLHVARAYVEALAANGGTEMRPALSFALKETATEGRLRQVVFLTDGAVGNEHQLFTTIAAMIGRTRLFTVGIGSAPNSYFMRKAAELGRGTHSHIGDVQEVGQRMEALFAKLERPALTDISVTWPRIDGLEVERYPATIPDLYSDQPVTFVARLAGQTLDQLTGELIVEGRRAGKAWDQRLRLDDMRAAPGVASLWGRARFGEIQDGLYRGRNPEQVRQDALAVALRHQLVTAYTSLVAVDDEVVRPDSERLKSGEVARNLPHGWDYERVFGPQGGSMELRQMPPDLLRKAGFGGQPVALPQTATSAGLQAVIGVLLVLGGLLMILIVVRSRSARSGAVAAG